MAKIITFSGPMGSGKSTAIEHLRNFFAGDVVNMKFAQPLYDIQEAAYERILGAYKRPPNFIKDRKLLQLLGTEWGRGLDENLWVNIWKEEVANILRNNVADVVTCDDVRFDNEAETVKAMGGVIIRLRSKHNTNRISTNNGISAHASEAGISDKFVDFTVNNDGTLEEFKTSLTEIFSSLWNNNKQ